VSPFVTYYWSFATFSTVKYHIDSDFQEISVVYVTVKNLNKKKLALVMMKQMRSPEKKFSRVKDHHHSIYSRFILSKRTEQKVLSSPSEGQSKAF